MTKDQLIRKLTSRKFWICLLSFITAILTAFHVPAESTSQVASIVMAFGSLIAYIFAEGWADASNGTVTLLEDEDDK